MNSVLVPVDLKRHEKVRAWADLPGVPVGECGKVLVVSGFTWVRYRVLFDNGVEMGLLDGRHIVATPGFIPIEDRVEEEAVQATDTGATAGEAQDSAGDTNPFGIPSHLLERSAKARLRHGGS